jgi:hypothetical protein
MNQIKSLSKNKTISPPPAVSLPRPVHTADKPKYQSELQDRECRHFLFLALKSQ